PDHWIEVQLRDGGGQAGNATVNLAVPPEHRAGYRGAYDLRGSPEAGYLFRIVCEGATNMCRGFAKDAATGEWWQLGDGFEVPARSTRLEIKTTGFAEQGASSHVWFDDCRVYPRPQTHYVTVILKRRDGTPPGVRDSTAEGHQVCLDPDNVKVPDCDLAVRLYDADGQRLIDEAHTGAGFGYALLRLASGWDVYPAAAILRVYANGHQLGADHVIQSAGVDGLYPDDVYAITVN
ncbi:MAG TPA: hypothetical protein VFE84_07955, partial [Patescibacteria group bacterium]|nr:hypothetical protein [Patescibacteria group bacterium]